MTSGGHPEIRPVDGRWVSLGIVTDTEVDNDDATYVKVRIFKGAPVPKYLEHLELSWAVQRPTHTCTVESPFRGDGHAECSCGWTSTPCRWIEDAYQQWVAHYAEMALAERTAP